MKTMTKSMICVVLLLSSAAQVEAMRQPIVEPGLPSSINQNPSPASLPQQISHAQRAPGGNLFNSFKNFGKNMRWFGRNMQSFVVKTFFGTRRMTAVTASLGIAAGTLMKLHAFNYRTMIALALFVGAHCLAQITYQVKHELKRKYPVNENHELTSGCYLSPQNRTAVERDYIAARKK